jgi:Integrase core domain.
MGRITQEAHHRQRMLEYRKNHTLWETAIRYRTSRKTVVKWWNRWDGTAGSLENHSRRPHRINGGHSPEELAAIMRAVKRHDWNDLLLAYQELRERHGYNRSYGSFKRVVSRLRKNTTKPKEKRKNKPYQRAEYPGQKLQLDVKFVPDRCVVDGKKYYQFTAKDECTRWTYREMYDEHSTYSAHDFLERLVRMAPFPIRAIQTDNGTEFTNALLVIKATHKSMFESALEEMGILYQRIRIATPRHNGKVERQHRTDELRFYAHLRMFSLADGRKQLAVYQRKSNDYIMTCLGLRSPNQVLTDYLAVF